MDLQVQRLSVDRDELKAEKRKLKKNAKQLLLASTSSPTTKDSAGDEEEDSQERTTIQALEEQVRALKEEVEANERALIQQKEDYEKRWETLQKEDSATDGASSESTNRT